MYIHIHIHTHIHIYIYIYIYIYVYTHIHVYIYIYTHTVYIYIYIYTHTHMIPGRPALRLGEGGEGGSLPRLQGLLSAKVTPSPPTIIMAVINTNSYYYKYYQY